MNNLVKDKVLENIDAIIFDMDGTLVDSMWIWKQIDIDYLARFEIPFPENLQEEIEGMSFVETAVYFKETFGIEDTLEQIGKDWNDMAFDFYANKIPLKPGALEFLKLMKANNIKMGIATSNSRELLMAAINRLGVGEYFDTLNISDDVKKGKPAPDIYLHVANILNVSPERTLVFEDITQGVMAAHAAGMKVCGVKDAFAIDHGHKIDEIADYYISDYTEIIGV